MIKVKCVDMSQFKIDVEEFNRKAQHIVDTVVKPQVEKYEQSLKESEFSQSRYN
jgi:uncharacterized protein YceH (UPF0502 family)